MEETIRGGDTRQALIPESFPMAFYIAQPFGDYGGIWVNGQINRIYVRGIYGGYPFMGLQAAPHGP
ncbi:MAG: hypothetical protein JW932_19335 [Deltaproteobacteria bacterium]|nr:hypothetical protein [Deltaproteobacteria bacterium]